MLHWLETHVVAIWIVFALYWLFLSVVYHRLSTKETVLPGWMCQTEWAFWLVLGGAYLSLVVLLLLVGVVAIAVLALALHW